ncbi:SDR family NAD(P)-dependent oxidoreductase [Actinomadura physcomitrii]|nr:SDR family NAD(P)-dependent oxidoreductase [Actinomadura physcomitrii]
MSHSGDVQGKKVLITGAAGPGIGAACARLFAEAGATVVLTDRSETRTPAAARDLAAATGATVVPAVIDVGREESVRVGVAAAVEAVGPLDVLVNNAAFTDLSPLVETSTRSWEKVLNVCLTGTFFMMRACLPAMIERRAGSVINIASVNAWTGPADGTASYSAAKAGVLGLTRAAASECGPHNVRINAVAPGFVPNPGIESLFGSDYVRETSQKAALRRAATPEEIAEAVLFLGSDRSSYVTGEAICVAGGLYYHA